MSGRWLNPSDVIESLRDVVMGALTEDDGCTSCSYAFSYELEGCDDCKPVKELLKALNLTTTVDH